MKGQAFIMDLMLGLLITVATLVSVVLFLPSSEPPFTHDSERVHLLMSEGVPADWNESTVIIPGFLSGGRFNETKILAFEALPVADQKELLGVQSDFRIFFSVNGTALSMCDLCGAEPASYEELLPIQRYSILNSTITLMEVRLYR